MYQQRFLVLKFIEVKEIHGKQSKNIQYYWVFGRFPSSGILENRKRDVSENEFVSVLR
jgi:hypothetical protein